MSCKEKPEAENGVQVTDDSRNQSTNSYSLSLDSVSSMSLLEEVPGGLVPGLGLPLATLLLDLLRPSTALIPSNISMNGGSWNWYMALTPFESIFLCFIMFEIFVLRYIEILPINLNNIIHGDPSGRKKREVRLCPTLPPTPHPPDLLTRPMLKLLLKVDQQECFLRSLCVLESERRRGNLKLFPVGTRNLLGVLKRLRSERERRSCNGTEENQVLSLDTVPFEEAVEMGSKNGSSHPCEQSYTLCPITTSDIIHYYKNIII